MLDSGPSEIHYSVCCKLFIGKASPEDIGRQRQLPMDMVFGKGSALDFRLLSVKDIATLVDSGLSKAPVKFMLQISLQRKSFEKVRLHSLSASTELKLSSVSRNVIFENRLYQSKQEKCFPEEKVEDSIPSNADINRVAIGILRRTELWCPTVIQMNTPRSLVKCQMHFLNVNGEIHASSITRAFESGAQRTLHRIQIMKNEDIDNNLQILSRDGEMNIRLEMTEFYDRKNTYVCQKRTFASPFRKDFSLSYDLKRLHQNGFKGKNLTIRANRDVFKVHPEIICARSPVFKAMLSNSMSEKLSNVIEMEDRIGNSKELSGLFVHLSIRYVFGMG